MRHKISIARDGFVIIETNEGSAKFFVRQGNGGDVSISIEVESIEKRLDSIVYPVKSMPVSMKWNPTYVWNEHESKNFADNRIPAIKFIREFTGLGLGEAKSLVERTEHQYTDVFVTLTSKEEHVRFLSAAKELQFDVLLK
jgi:hypothetical protein